MLERLKNRARKYLSGGSSESALIPLEAQALEIRSEDLLEQEDRYISPPVAYEGQKRYSNFDYSIWDGSKFPGGFGQTQIQIPDYWTLRQRSAQLYAQNKYVRGILRRLITTEINTGLIPEATPENLILGLDEEWLNEWTEYNEARFLIWANNPKLCDYEGYRTFWEMQRIAKLEAYVEGDVLVILRRGPEGLPRVQLIKGGRVRNPLYADKKNAQANNNTIEYGVERNPRGRVVAYWVQMPGPSGTFGRDNARDKFVRIRAYGMKTGRRLAWLYYGCDKRMEEIRGAPMVGLMLQSANELDRYADASQRKAVISSIIAGFMKKTKPKPGRNPFPKPGQIAEGEQDGNETNRYNFVESLPGLFLYQLEEGEEPVFKGGEGTDVNFGPHEEVVIATLAWAHEIPPGVVRLAFSHNYSASTMEIILYKHFLYKRWKMFGEELCGPVRNDWFIAEVNMRKLEAPGLLEALNDPMKYDIEGAWLSCEFYGTVVPHVDVLKFVRASQILVKEGWSTNAREARQLTGTKYSTNIKRLVLENQQKIEAMRPLEEFKKEFELKDSEEKMDSGIKGDDPDDKQYDSEEDELKREEVVN